VTLYLGVDAGSSKTRAAVADASGRVLASATGGFGSVEGPDGIDGGVAEIARTVSAALAACALGPADVRAACYAVAGNDGPADDREIRAGLARAALPATAEAARLVSVNDGYAALRAGLRRPWGVVSAAGTGTVVVGRGPDGRIVQVGGIGALSGDAGGGVHLGWLAVQAVMMAEQGALAPTSLRAAVAELFGTDDLLGLVRAGVEGPRTRLAALAPAVHRAAAAGDLAAQAILVRTGRHLGRMATGAIARLDLLRSDVEVVLAGGTYRGESPLMADAATLEVHRRAPRADVHRALREPVAGALILAREADVGDVDSGFLAALAEALPEPPSLAPSPPA
jgi:N-acetylglucosamine kinase